jgi:transposase
MAFVLTARYATSTPCSSPSRLLRLDTRAGAFHETRPQQATLAHGEREGVTRGEMSEQELKQPGRPRKPNNRTTTSFRISDELWRVLQPLLPVPFNTHRFGGGRPRVPDRQCANAIFYVLRTGCQWQALDQTGLCAHSTAHARFQEWVKAGVFLTLWQVGVVQ